MSEQIKTRVTAAEYFQLPVTNLPMQLLDGEVIEMPSPEVIHQRLIRRLVRVLDRIVDQIAGEVFVSPLDVKLDEDNVPQPDIFWVAADGRCKPDERNRLVGAPDLIVEVLSPSTARYDRTTKFLLYEKHGVREYWIIDPRRQYLEVWRLEQNEYVLQGSYGMGEQFVSTVLNGVTVDLSTVFNA